MYLLRICLRGMISCLFFFNDTATTEIYTLSLHALFRSPALAACLAVSACERFGPAPTGPGPQLAQIVVLPRSEEHTSELQSLAYLVCRLLLEKKKKNNILVIATTTTPTLSDTISMHL